MTARIVNQDTVLREARDLLRTARTEVLITSPWIRQQSANTLLRDVLPAVESGQLRVRIVYRLKEANDLEITELEGIKALEEAGCEIRFSNRLHAKVVVVDDHAGIVSSSNLTATAGYGELPADWRNEELGVLIQDDPVTLADLRREFQTIWDAASALDADTLGVAMDFPNVDEFSFVAIRPIKRGEYAMATDLDGRVILGRIVQVTAYNRSFPRMSDPMWVTQGYAPAGTSGGVPLADLQSLFSHPSKDHGYLVAKTFHEPASAFQIARVEVLKAVENDRLRSTAVPVAPGSDVRRANTDLLVGLIGDGDLSLGVTHHHEAVPVRLNSSEILSKHLAVLGMTGSGKSNSLKVLIQNLLDGAHPDLRVVVIDTHGEYVPIAAELAAAHRTINVEVRRWLLDEDVVVDLMRAARKDNAFHQQLVWDAYDSGADTTLGEFVADLAASGDDRRVRLAAAAQSATDLCLWEEEVARVVSENGVGETFEAPGLYILDLRSTLSLEDRGARAAAVMRYLFERARAANGAFPCAVVVDEAQNFAPEQQTGWLSRARESFDAMFQIASEGRKFGIALILSTQRPARVNKDILSQCNTHMIFRVANLEDLMAIGGSFEAASKPLLDELPGFDTGVCVVGGTAINMVTRVVVPLFGGRQ
jgi:hypothetical protein